MRHVIADQGRKRQAARCMLAGLQHQRHATASCISRLTLFFTSYRRCTLNDIRIYFSDFSIAVRLSTFNNRLTFQSFIFNHHSVTKLISVAPMRRRSLPVGVGEVNENDFKMIFHRQAFHNQCRNQREDAADPTEIMRQRLHRVD